MDADARRATIARGRGYDLLGRAIRSGLDGAVLAQLRTVEAMAAHLGPELDLEAAAARHQSVFGRQVLPWESVWLDPESRLDGAAAGRLRRLLQRAGLVTPVELATEPDHLGNELRWLARACGAEVAAGDDPHEGARARQVQRDLLDQHLLRWLPPLSVAASRADDGWCAALVQLALALATEHRRALGGPPTPWTLPPAALELESRCGVLLSHDDLRAHGRRSEVPGGFSSRSRVLETRIRAAGQLGRSAALWGAVAACLGAWGEGLGRVDEPVLAATIGPWKRRLDETRRMVDAVGSRVGGVLDDAR